MNATHRSNLRKSALGCRSAFSRAFTLIELLTVIAIIGIIAAAFVGLAPAAGAKMRESRIRAEMQQLVTAIEEYKSRYGFYPPDGIYTSGSLSGLANPAVHPLFYELVGMLVVNPFDAINGYFQSFDGSGKITSQMLQTVFGREGIANSSADRKKILSQNFRSSQHAKLDPKSALYPDLEVFTTALPWPKNDPNPPVPQNPTLNPWRYVSTNPTNNPSSYDLWVEYYRGKEKITLGNWKR